MSKFKSFASQGSYRDYLLQAPDETAKIKEETARTISGKQRAEQFRQGNADLYLQAQKLAQSQEQLSRETNFNLETENRRLYKEALDRDYKIQSENDRIRAEQQQNTYKQLSDLSKTASELFVDFNQKITENQTNANTVNTILAGTTFEENVAIQGMVNNLTEAEFAQQSFIKQKVAEGKDVKALWVLYNNRNTRGFIENTGVIENTANSATPFLQETLRNLDPSLTPEQKRIQVETAWREWLANSFKDANGKQLNPKLVSTIGAPIFNRAYTNLMGELDTEIDKANKEKLRQDTFLGYDRAWGNGVEGVKNKYQQGHLEGRGKQTRDEIAAWVIARLEAGTLSTDDALAIVNAEYEGPNKDTTTWSKQHPTDPNLGKINETIRKIKRGVVADAQLDEKQRQLALDAQLTELYNEVAQDRSISKQDRMRAEEIVNQAGIPGYQSPIMDYFIKQEDSARYDAAARVVLENLRAKGSLTLAYVQSLKNISGKTLDEYSAHAIRQEKYRSESLHKTDIGVIEARVSQHPRLSKASITGEKNASVLLMQERFVQRYAEYYEKLGDRDAARGKVLAEIDLLQSNENVAFTRDGQYAEIVEQEKGFAKAGDRHLQNYKAALDVILNPETRNNYQAIGDALGAEILYGAYDTIKSGGAVPQIVKNTASLLRMNPFDFLNKTMVKSGLPPLTLNSQVAQIQANMKPITPRLYNAPYRTNDRINRANAINAGNGLSTVAIRGDSAVAKFRSAIISQESGGSYTIVNPDSGAIGIGQVMPENVGPWTQRYLGRTLTPEEFRVNPAAQDAVVNGRFKDMLADQQAAGYKGEEMIRRAASIWYSGNGNLWNNTNPQYYNGRRYPSIAEYTLSIWKKFQSSY